MGAVSAGTPYVLDVIGEEVWCGYLDACSPCCLSDDLVSRLAKGVVSQVSMRPLAAWKAVFLPLAVNPRVRTAGRINPEWLEQGVVVNGTTEPLEDVVVPVEITGTSLSQ